MSDTPPAVAVPRRELSRGKKLGLGFGLALVFGVGAGMGLVENADVRKWLFGVEEKPLPATVPFGLRSMTIDQRDAAVASGDLVTAAGINAQFAQEAVLRSKAVHDIWMRQRHPETKLFPESLKDREWNYRNTAADFFCFLFHQAFYTDEPSLPALRESMAAEAALAAPGELCQPVWYDTGKPIRENPRELLFASSEYAKDGLLSLWDGYGDELVYARLIEVTDAILNHSTHPSKFGPIPDGRAEVTGEMLQVLSRLSLVSENPAYPQMAARIGDAVVMQSLPANHGLPAGEHDYESDKVIDREVQLRDHGNELVGGLGEVYALAVSRRDDPAWAERADRWAEPLAVMFEIILEHSVNEEGLIANAMSAETRKVTDPRASDNWGYVLNGVLLFVQAAQRHDQLEPARLAAMLGRVDAIVDAVVKTNGLPWEGTSHDGYADTLESALYLAYHRPETAAKLLPWVDDQIDIMFGIQKPNGYVQRHYLDGNFIRTALMYADARSGGWRLEPWSPTARIGMARDDAGQAVLVIEATESYTGVLRPQRPEHALTAALPWDWPRLNSWPGWLTPDRITTVTAVEGDAAVPVPSVEQLAEGWPVTIPAGGRLVLKMNTRP
ncbi:MAG: hypothetical protein ACFCVE_04065 [Phycisphaerae bacterium]